MVIAPRSKSPRTPTKSIIRPLESGAVTPGAIEELSSQIESLIQRGRKLRELKNSMSRVSPSVPLGETRVSVLETSIEPNTQFNGTSCIDDILAAVNASDPLFSEPPRAPVVAVRPFDSSRVESERAPTPMSARIPTKEYEFEYKVESFNLTITPKSDVSVRLRTVDGVGETVTGSEKCDVAVEVWRKKSKELAGMGRLGKRGKLATVECFDVWLGDSLGVVTVSVRKKEEFAEEVVLESLVESGKTSRVLRNESRNDHESLDDFLSHRSIVKKKQSKPSVVVSTPVLTEPPSTELKTCVESFVLFSSSPSPENVDEIIEENSSSNSTTTQGKVLMSDLLQRAATFADSVTYEIEKSSDPHLVLQKRILELDALTQKLNGCPDEPADISYDTSPITQVSFVPPPDFTSLLQSRLPARRRRKLRKPRARSVKKPEISRDREPFSQVTVGAISLEPSQSCLKSIEKARRSISTLRGSLLKDADRICSVLQSASRLEDEEDEDQFT